MGVQSPTSQVIRFGIFEVDLRSGELRKAGVLIHLPPQPFKILALLASRPGQLVTREEIQQQVWGSETFVDFDHGLNFAIKKIREALGDNADTPRYIETLPRRGYRFIAPVEIVAHGGASAVAPVSPPADAVAAIYDRRPANAVRRYSRRHLALAGAGLVAVVTALLALNVVGMRDRWMTAVGAGSARPREGGALPYPKIESIAVLPLKNLSSDPEQEYFADGMTEELITNLGKISALRVISRTSVMQYKGTKKPLPQIARELNVDAVVEGSVLRSGSRVRITANLLHGPTDRHLWADSYESDLGDVLVLQDEVARAIASEIQIRVTPNEQASLASAHPVNPKAHEAYLKGRFFFNNLSKPNVLKATEYAKQAVEIDPDYAPAYGLLASSYWESGLHSWGDLPDRVRAEKTRAAAMKALEIDDSLAEGHFGLGIVLDMHDWNWAGAEHEFRRAIELNPNFARSHAMYAWHLLFVGRRDESIQEAKRAVELDPFSSHILMTVTAIHYFTRQYDQSLERARRWLEIFPDSPGPYQHMWFVYQATGKYDEAMAARKKWMALSGQNAKRIAAVERAYQIGGIRGVRRWELENWLPRAAERGIFETVAHTYALLGEKDKAFEWLEKGYEGRDHAMVFIKTLYAYDSMRSDPRFQDLLRKMNFPP